MEYINLVKLSTEDIENIIMDHFNRKGEQVDKVEFEIRQNTSGMFVLYETRAFLKKVRESDHSKLNVDIEEKGLTYHCQQNES